jgi:hypothetical protein
MQIWTNIKTEEQAIAFASLPYKGQRIQWLQAYFSNLFDLTESADFLSPDTFDKIQIQKWNVGEYAESKGYDLDRDCEWCVCYSGSEIWIPSCSDDGMMIK